MHPLAIPRRLIVIAVSAAATGVVLYASRKMKEAKDQEREQQRKRDRPTDSEQQGARDEHKAADGATAPRASAADGKTGAEKELAQFLAGETWHDEIGWQSIWEREAIEGPEAWLKKTGKAVLAAERKKLLDHPALLAGCRRRWIVVCRYASIDVSDAATLWNEAEAA